MVLINKRVRTKPWFVSSRNKDKEMNMDKDIFEHKRKSHIEKGEIYFWTA